MSKFLNANNNEDKAANNEDDKAIVIQYIRFSPKTAELKMLVIGIFSFSLNTILPVLLKLGTVWYRVSCLLNENMLE